MLNKELKPIAVSEFIKRLAAVFLQDLRAEGVRGEGESGLTHA
jgi:hypothetical protein